MHGWFGEPQDTPLGKSSTALVMWMGDLSVAAVGVSSHGAREMAQWLRVLCPFWGPESGTGVWQLMTTCDFTAKGSGAPLACVCTQILKWESEQQQKRNKKSGVIMLVSDSHQDGCHGCTAHGPAPMMSSAYRGKQTCGLKYQIFQMHKVNRAGDRQYEFNN